MANPLFISMIINILPVIMINLSDNFIWVISSGAAVAIAAGFLSSFVVIRRMALVSDILSHVALPGIAIALLFNIDPFLGALAFLVMASLGTWFFEKKTHIPSEAIIGVFFTAALALGVVLIPDEALIESLFGNLFSITLSDALMIIIVSAAVFISLVLLYKKLLLSIISKDLASSVKANPDLISLLFFLIFSVVVALGIKLIGTLLMGALTILPAVIARNLSWSFKSYAVWSVVFAVTMTLCGIIFANFLNWPPGPTVILTGIILFVVSLIFRKS